ncbi:MAG: carbohydrate kinase, partial [Muribaculaceae bacterium]|nr:carbohydrate kinase [Muribaculaceae bacterium]
PLRDSIIWCDSRAVPYGREAFDSLGHEQCLSHLLNSPGNFTAAKLAWVKENEPEVFARIHKIMLPADYIAMRMTGELVTNPEGLSEMMLWDFKTNAPAAFLMDYFGFPADILPEVRSTFCEQGRLTPEAAAELGLAPGIPVTYRAGDQPNNALSLNVFEPGEIASTAGTSGVVYGVNGTVDYDPLSRVNNFAHVNHTAEAPRIGVLTCINGTGILNSWVKRNVAPAGISYDEMNKLAAEVPVGALGLSIMPFGNGAERLLENADPGCSIHGLNFNTHDRRHIIRAAQEGIVFAFMYGIEIMKGLGLDVTKIHAGNANMFLSPVFRQTLADVSGATIELYDTDGSVGAAKGAGIGAGIYKDRDEAFASLELLGTVEPDPATRPAVLKAYELWKSRLNK